MIYKVFDVAHGSASFLMSPTGKTELCDLGARADWSPLQHVYTNYVRWGERLDRLLLTHHHGDHLDDVFNLISSRMPRSVVRRPLTGKYEAACRNSNSTDGHRRAMHFDQLFSGYTETASPDLVRESSWGIEMRVWSLNDAQSYVISSSDGMMANCCSFITLYSHLGTKVLQCGDMEKDGMAMLLEANPDLRIAVRGVNVLIAPHHGHKSSFSSELMDAIGRPDVVIASAMSGDEHLDSRYSDSTFVKGITWTDGTLTRLLTTRACGAITVRSGGGGEFRVTCWER